MTLDPIPGPQGLDEAQLALWDNVVSGRRARPGDPPPASLAALGGPFNPWMYAAGAGVHAVRLGEYLRFEGSLDDRLREMAILTVATHYRAEFEFWAHAKVAREVGLPEVVIEAVRSRSDDLDGGPEGAPGVYAAVRQLLQRGRIEGATYEELHGRLGSSCLVELVMLTGYYAMVSMTLNVFEVAVPGQSASFWPAAEPQ